jgi:subfamily B ATP-binding cassette protein MsbA
MKTFWEIFGFGFRYKALAILTIVGNLFFTLFNLLSLVLFIPFLQLIFRTKGTITSLTPPSYSGKIADLPNFIADWYNYTMNQMVMQDPQKALFLVCIFVFAAFFSSAS